MISALILVSLLAGAPTEGKALWDAKCAACHGKDGSGQTPIGLKLGIKDYRDAKWQAVVTDAQLITDITGGVGSKMPAYGKKLGAADIVGVVGVIRGFKK
jgi:mono/diheme cytochrome c family protein